MPKQRKLWGWTNWRDGKQVREIMYAESQAECIRASGISKRQFRNSASVSANPVDMEIASAKPGVLFYCDLATLRTPASEWKELEPAKEGTNENA
jgi:hypothetical protein